MSHCDLPLTPGKRDWEYLPLIRGFNMEGRRGTSVLKQLAKTVLTRLGLQKLKTVCQFTGNLPLLKNPATASSEYFDNQVASEPAFPVPLTENGLNHAYRMCSSFPKHVLHEVLLFPSSHHRALRSLLRPNGADQAELTAVACSQLDIM
jgi:hypothetical protein